MPDLTWQRSSFCANGTCVEVAWQRAAACANGHSCAEVGHHDGEVLVRDGKDPDGPVLTFTAEEWRAFCDGVTAGEFRCGHG